MAYDAQWITVENGVTALFIADVVMASYLTAAERPDFGIDVDLDDTWWANAENTAAQRESKGKFAGLIFKRNTFTHTDPFTAGRFENLRWRRPYALADWIVTDPVEIAAIIRGERTQLSIEAQVHNHLVWGVELIQGSEGHFSEDIPEMRVQGVSVQDPEFRELKTATATAARLKQPDRELAVALSKGVRLMEDTPPAGGQPPAQQPAPAFSPEQTAEIKKIVMQVIEELQQGQATMSKADIEKIVVAKLGTTRTAAKATNPDVATLSAELDAVNTDKAELEARLVKIELDREIDGYVAKLAKNGHPQPEDKLREQFASLKTAEGRQQMFARLDAFKRHTDSPPEDPESGHGSQTVDAEYAKLKADYAKKPEVWKNAGYDTAESYANYCLTGDMTRAPAGLTAKK